MSNNYGANQYKQTSIMTANRGQILIMLYEAAIRNVKKASAMIDAKNIAGKGTAIGRAHDIVNELMNTLDFEVGGKIAEDLERLYTFMSGELVKANIESSKERLAAIQKLLETLLDGWRVAVAEVNRGQAGPTPDKPKGQP